MTPNLDAIRVFLIEHRYCSCGCGRVADVVRGPRGTKRIPRWRGQWRALSLACAEAEQKAAAA